MFTLTAKLDWLKTTLLRGGQKIPGIIGAPGPKEIALMYNLVLRVSLFPFASPLSPTPVKGKRDPEQNIINWHLAKEYERTIIDQQRT